jgi:hypothetical protein
MANRKIRPGNRIAQILRQKDPDAEFGAPVTLDDIKAMFSNDPVLSATTYKISGYVGDIRKYDQGVVRVVKNGRSVLSYQLMNWFEFDANGHRLTGEALTDAQSEHNSTLPVVEVINEYSSTSVDNEPSDPTVDDVIMSDTDGDFNADTLTESEAVPETAAALTSGTETAAKPKRTRGKFTKAAA